MYLFYNLFILYTSGSQSFLVVTPNIRIAVVHDSSIVHFPFKHFENVLPIWSAWHNPQVEYHCSILITTFSSLFFSWHSYIESFGQKFKPFRLPLWGVIFCTVFDNHDFILNVTKTIEMVLDLTSVGPSQACGHTYCDWSSFDIQYPGLHIQ